MQYSSAPAAAATAKLHSSAPAAATTLSYPAAAATAKLQASATLKPWPHGFATSKHHLISCRNFCSSCCCHCQAPSFSSEPLPTPLSCRKAKLQTSALNPWPHGFATPKHHLISSRNDVQKCTAKMSNVTSESLEKTSKNR